MSKSTFVTQIAAIRTELDTLLAAFPTTKTEINSAGDDAHCNNRVSGSPGSFRNVPGGSVVTDLDNVVLSLSAWSGRWS